MKKKWSVEGGWVKQRIMKIGNSIGVTVPVDFVKAVGIKAGDTVEVKKRVESNEVIYKFSGVCQLPIATNFLKKRQRRK